MVVAILFLPMVLRPTCLPGFFTAGRLGLRSTAGVGSAILHCVQEGTQCIERCAPRAALRGGAPRGGVLRGGALRGAALRGGALRIEDVIELKLRPFGHFKGEKSVGMPMQDT